MSKKCRAFSESKLGLEAADNRKAFYAGWDAAIRQVKEPAQQEPVVWMYQDKSTHAVSFQKHMRAFVDHGATYETPLYTRPQAREPLTDEQIKIIWRDIDDSDGMLMRFARAIEAAHGIKGEK